MIRTVTSENNQTLKGRGSAYLIDREWSQTHRRCRFSTSNLISSSAIRLGPRNYQNSVATPCALTSWFTETEPAVRYREEICSSFYNLFYDSSLSSQLMCSNRVTHSYFPLSFLSSSITPRSLPPLLQLLSHPLSSPNTPLQALSPHLSILHASLPSLYPPSASTYSARSPVWFSEVSEGSVSRGLCEPVSGWCNYDGWSNFQRRLLPRGFSPPCFLLALMTF